MKKIDYVNNIMDEIIKWTENYNNIFGVEEFIDYSDVDRYMLNNPFPTRKKLGLTLNINAIVKYFKYVSFYNNTCQLISNLKNQVNIHNDNLMSKKVDHFRKICGKVEDRNLDGQQINAIIRENRNQLIIAGAGSGKTTTIIGKVKYLLKCNQVESDEILLLSFTNASAEEIKKRVEAETNCKIDTFTFHKLGLEIIKQSTNKAVNIYEKDVKNFIKDKIEKLLMNPNYLNKLINFIIYDFNVLKEESDFCNLEEYEKYLTQNPPTTFKREVVKSNGELYIANFLYSNGIDYVYEDPYVVDTSTIDFQQYKPDFHILNTNCYIEYFGIDENGQVAPHFVSKNDKSPTENYLEAIDWKRKVHKENGTKLIESFYYDFKRGELLKNLERELLNKGIKLSPKSDEQLWKEINEKNVGILDEIINILATLINLIKSNNMSFDDFKKLCLANNVKNGISIVELLEPIFTSYNEFLRGSSLIDFNDMINIATDCVKENKYVHNYKYVIVDEYQDISMSRFNLLKELRNQKDYKLFCVGDDWQSIYRFSGSDVGLIMNFEKYWGDTYISRIERTYRFSNMMANISGNFVMQNPHQIVKKIRGFDESRSSIGCIYAKTENDLILRLEEKLKTLPLNSSVYFIGRYKFDIDILTNKFYKKYNNVSQMVDVCYLERRDLKISYLTAHKSKGLQADYVFILNNKDYGMGFPSKISDLPIIRLLLDNTDDFLYSEERRLFYVAMTRSIKKTIFLVLSTNKSSFIREIESNYEKIINKEFYECPECGSSLVKKNGKFGPFFGCSNYPNCKYTKNIK